MSSDVETCRTRFFFFAEYFGRRLHRPYGRLKRNPGPRNVQEGLFEYPMHLSVRTQAELHRHLSLRNERISSRWKSGVTQDATAQERFSKLGETFPAHRDL